MMALLFLLRERQIQSEILSLLSAGDVKVFLAKVLSGQDQTLDEIIRQIQLHISDGNQLSTQLTDSKNLTQGI